MLVQNVFQQLPEDPGSPVPAHEVICVGVLQYMIAYS